MARQTEHKRGRRFLYGEDTKQVQIKVPLSLMEDLDAMSVAECRSLGAQAVYLLRAGVEAWKTRRNGKEGQ